ncbi:hypothetical protein DY000_02058935 [Brassica cretica]|uniref:Uncharacterized protein n=1 Tax=Brassica cretica TaxID=69181 RepID=A0ABQ7AR89_BRACR|nr:hypothetical protein DY000_02058935 [Brassica cretica]
MVKKTTHDGSQVLNRSWSKRSSTGVSGHDAVLVIPLQPRRGRMVMFWYRECISHGGEKHGVVHISWERKAHLVWNWGRKAHLVWKFPGEERDCNVVAEPEDCCARSAPKAKRERLKIPCGVKVLSWSRVDLESKRVSWRKGKRNKLGSQVYDLKKVE